MKAGLTIEELAAEIMRQKEAKADYVVNTGRLRMEPCGTELVLRILDENNADRIEPLDISEQAHRQIGTHLSIPAKYYTRMLTEYPELLAENVNAWFEREGTARMLRVLDGRMRAFVSNRYLRIDHHEVSCAAIPVIGEMPDIHFVSCQITDSRMYIKLVNPHMQEEIAPGITVQSGLLITNSEVGLGSVSVQPLIYYPEVDAGMIVRTSSTKRVHSGPVYSVEENFHIPPEQSYLQDGSPFLEQIRNTVRDAVDEQMFEQTAAHIREAREAHFSADHVLDIVQAAGQEFGVTESEQDGVLEQLVTDNDMSRYGLANAVTRHSQHIESYDRATALETIGYDILSMPSARWNRINQAAAA